MARPRYWSRDEWEERGREPSSRSIVSFFNLDLTLLKSRVTQKRSYRDKSSAAHPPCQSALPSLSYSSSPRFGPTPFLNPVAPVPQRASTAPVSLSTLLSSYRDQPLTLPSFLPLPHLPSVRPSPSSFPDADDARPPLNAQQNVKATMALAPNGVGSGRRLLLQCTLFCSLGVFLFVRPTLSFPPLTCGGVQCGADDVGVQGYDQYGSFLSFPFPSSAFPSQRSTCSPPYPSRWQKAEPSFCRARSVARETAERPASTRRNCVLPRLRSRLTLTSPSFRSSPSAFPPSSSRLRFSLSRP